MRNFWILMALLASALIGWWNYAAPPAHHVVAPAHQVGPVPTAITAVKSADDFIAAHLKRAPSALPGHDEVILQEHLGRAFVTAMDGWIWRIDLATGAAERFVQAPMSPAGARLVPGDDEHMLFCATRLDDNRYPDTVQPGIYELTFSTKAIRPVALRVPLSPPITSPKPGNEGSVFTEQELPPASIASLNERNSRQIAFCNDIDVSRDGQRIYMSEPFDYAGASSGTGSMAEAVTLARNGRLWQFDRTQNTVRLVAQNYNFIDGVLLEYASDTDPQETSILVTETTKYRINRLHLRGPLAGTDKILWDNLPGLPDGLDRDAQGRVWVGFIKERTPVASWIHAHPWIKPLLLRLPRSLLPITKPTAIMALSPDASQALFYTQHDGRLVHDIAVVVPGKNRLYLPTFDRTNTGLVSIPYPDVLASGAALKPVKAVAP
jgi:sugar lactone lactonase YvrE